MDEKTKQIFPVEHDCSILDVFVVLNCRIKNIKGTTKDMSLTKDSMFGQVTNLNSSRETPLRECFGI